MPFFSRSVHVMHVQMSCISICTCHACTDHAYTDMYMSCMYRSRIYRKIMHVQKRAVVGNYNTHTHHTVVSLQRNCLFVSVEGYCRGIAAGNVKVGWNVGDVLFGVQRTHNVGDSHTGWMSTVRIIVEEISVENANTVIV